MTQSKNHRSRTEIIHDIETARSDGNGAGKTKIMYNAFLSYNQVKEYLTILIDNGLLQYDLGNQKFRITEKGLMFLERCDQIGNLAEEQQYTHKSNCRSDRRRILPMVPVLLLARICHCKTSKKLSSDSCHCIYSSDLVESPPAGGGLLPISPPPPAIACRSDALSEDAASSSHTQLSGLSEHVGHFPSEVKLRLHTHFREMPWSVITNLSP
jgi:predicted transcriptional regulator